MLFSPLSLRKTQVRGLERLGLTRRPSSSPVLPLSSRLDSPLTITSHGFTSSTIPSPAGLGTQTAGASNSVVSISLEVRPFPFLSPYSSSTPSLKSNLPVPQEPPFTSPLEPRLSLSLSTSGSDEGTGLSGEFRRRRENKRKDGTRSFELES